MKDLVSKFLKPGKILVDPCAGTFATAKACMVLLKQCRFVGSEINKAVLSSIQVVNGGNIRKTGSECLTSRVQRTLELLSECMCTERKGFRRDGVSCLGNPARVLSGADAFAANFAFSFEQVQGCIIVPGMPTNLAVNVVCKMAFAVSQGAYLDSSWG